MFRLADETTFDPYRLRSQGVLNHEELAFCQQYQIALGYDPVQIGWVPLTVREDFTDPPEFHGVLNDLKHTLALAIIEQEFQGRIGVEESRSRAFETAAALAKSNSRDLDLSRANQIYTELRREAARFLPLPASNSASSAEFHYRHWNVSDAERYATILGNPAVWEFLPDAPPAGLDRETAEAMITVANKDPRHDVFAVEHDEVVIGQIRLLYNQEYPTIRGAEIAYLLDEEFWGRGLMTRVLADFSIQALEERDYDFLCAWIRPENLGSVKCAERAGYSRDKFPGEDEYAASVGRAGFQRYLCFAGDVGA